jgi:acyl dehydratase
VFWEDLVEGDTISGPGVTVTDSHLVSWAGLTGDFVSLHLDEQFAAASPFGRRVAAGPFTMSIALGLLTQTGVFGNIRAWLGVDAVRATAPVYIGDTIRPSAVIRETTASELSDLGSWTLDYTVTNQRDEIVMTFISRKLIHKRAAGR